MEEVWKDIKGFEGSYMVSSLGRIKSLDRLIWNKANNSYSIQKGRIHKLDNHNKPYYQIGLSINSKYFKYLVHRLVALTFIRNPNNYPEVNHINGNKLDNTVDNLEWCTRIQNQQHAKKIGGYDKMQKGVDRPNHILNDEAVRHIRKKELRNIDYCRLYNVKPSTISCLQSETHKRWAHVK